MPLRGRGRYPRPPASDATLARAVRPAAARYWPSRYSFAGLCVAAVWPFCAAVPADRAARDLGNHAGGDPRVTRRRLQFIVPQQGLYDSDVGATLEEMGREAVA